jgi:DNA-binding beta-propeller fold protein YncE
MRTAIGQLALAAILICAGAGATLAAPASAQRTLLSEAALETGECVRCTGSSGGVLPPPEGQIEGPCGVAIGAGGRVYVADYFHRVIDVFGAPSPTTPGQYVSQIALPGSNPVFGINTLDGVCGLAFDAEGNLYGNEWHQGVVRLTGGEATIDTGESTGLAIDPAANRLYVDDRTRIVEYALPFTPGDKPLATIGAGHLGDGYGLAAFEGRVYVADASTDAIQVFEPETDASTPVATIAGPFESLIDASLAIDPSNGHLLVVDNRQPGFEHPESAVLEFGPAAGGYAYLGKLPGAPIDGGPSGIAVTPGGEAIVTDGNSELANAFLYGSYEAGGSAAPAGGSGGGAGVLGAASAGGALGGAKITTGSATASPRGASASEVVQHGGVRVSFQGALAPRTLPRHGSRPVRASVGAKVIPLGKRKPPQLRRIEIAINRNGHFSPGALPTCRLDEIQPATTEAALAACRRSLVGKGTFSARVLLPEQAPFPSSGRVYAFNARWHGRPAILAHVYGTEPLPTSYTLPFELVSQHGTFGTLLRASLPAVTAESAYVTSITLTLGRGRYLTAGCPAPSGFREAVFPFARATLAFAGERNLDQTLTRSCRAES